MRSRYSAFFFRRIDYLVQTTHPDTREENLAQELEQIIHDLNWRKLNVVATSKGGPDDKTGKVEFTATYSLDREIHEVHEISRFRRLKGRWMYLDGKG